MKRTTGHCPAVLDAGPRAGQVCGRRFMSPHEACEKHRPPPPAREFAQDELERRRARDRERARERERARAKRATGIPAGWVV